MKGVDLMTQLINTGAKQKVSGKQSGSSSSDQSDFEKMLEQAGQQQGFTTDNTSEGGTSTSGPAETGAVSGEEEPGMEQMSIAAALVTVQPMIPVDTITPVEVADIAPAAAEAVMPETNLLAQQAAAAPVVTAEAGQEQLIDGPVAEEAVALEVVSEQPVEAVTADAQSETEQQADVAPEKQQGAAVRVDDNDQPVVEDASVAAEAPVFERMETVPVKVAEAAELVEPQADDAAQKLVQHIEQAMAQGESTVELSLTPASLGQLTIEITRSGDGNLSIVLTTVTEKAAQLIDRHAASLQNMLANSTQNVHVEVETRTHEPQAQQFLNPDGQNNPHHQQQRQQKKDDDRNDGDFLQQLRLGLVGLD